MAKLKQKQQGALMFVTLIILLIVSVLGISTMDTTGLEMKMSSNSRDQQTAFEAAEYTLSWVENNIQTIGYNSDQLTNNADCGAICFEPTCTNGYCFNGSNATDWSACTLNSPATEPYADAALWGDTRSRSLAVPGMGITTRYIIEFRCYTALDPELVMDVANNAKVYRITALAVGSGGKSRTMLRSTMKEL